MSSSRATPVAAGRAGSPRRPWWRWLLRGALALLALLLLAWTAIWAQAEWRFRQPATIVAWTPAPGDLDTGTGPDDHRPVLILLHGAGLNGQSWQPFVRALSPDFRAIAPDLPGHGRRRSERYTLASAQATIAAIAESVAPAPVFVVGDSLGGYSAMTAVDVVPHDRLRGIVVSGSSARFDGLQYWNWARDLPKVALVLAMFDEDTLAPKVLERFGMADADEQAIIAAGVNAGAVAPAARELMFSDLDTRLAAAKVPVLVINGALDERAVAQQDAFAAATGAEVQVVADTQHGLSLWIPADFAARVEKFARRQLSADAVPTEETR